MRTMCSKRHHIPRWDCPPLSFLLDEGIQWKQVWPVVSGKGWHWFLHMDIEKSLVGMVNFWFQVCVVIEHLSFHLTWTWHWNDSKATNKLFLFVANFMLTSKFYMYTFLYLWFFTYLWNQKLNWCSLTLIIV